MFASGNSVGSPCSPVLNRLVKSLFTMLAEPAVGVAVGALEEGRRIDGVVHRGRKGVDPRVGVVGVVEVGDRPGRRALEAALAGVLRREAQRRRQLIVDAECRLLAERLERRREELQVVGRARRLRHVRQRIQLQDVHAGLIEPLLRNPVAGECPAADGISQRRESARRCCRATPRSRRSVRPASARGTAAACWRRCAAGIRARRRRTACCCRRACRPGRRACSPSRTACRRPSACR